MLKTSREKYLERYIADRLADGEDIVLATVLGQSGSTPRLAGARMVVHQDGHIAGTIGGGLVEALVIQKAVTLLERGLAQIESFSLTGADVDSMDMICGGQLDVLLTPVNADRHQRAIFDRLSAALAGGRSAVLVTALEAADAEGMAFERCLVLADGRMEGEVSYPADWVLGLADQSLRQRQTVFKEVEGRRFLAEYWSSGGTLFIFGAGHVSQQVAALAKMVDFRVVVLDDRPEFADSQRFPEADEVRALESFDGVMDPLGVDENSYVVIVTRGHKHDKTVLAQALATPAGYVGMIGSRRKRDTIYRALLKEGVGQEDIDRVHCPIGLPIGADTPAEIAVSIVAELIQERSARG